VLSQAHRKTLLIGPNPPPHGGISVHVSGVRRRLVAAGVPCAILDTNQIQSRLRFAMTLSSFAVRGWTMHLHTNGHNPNSWLLALWGAIAGKLRGGSTLTIHSGMMPGYLRTCPVWRRKLAAVVCGLYSRIICVGPELRDAVISLGVAAERTVIAPACLAVESPAVTLDPHLREWIARHRPLLSTALFFRPEYGFNLLIEAVVQLRLRHPALGCLVMGSGEQHAEAVERLHQAGLARDVLLLGDVGHEICLALMAQSQVFIRPTLVDGDSLSVREAIALGVPVVASRVGTRPAGTLLFQAGDFEDMLSKLDFALEASVTA